MFKAVISKIFRNEIFFFFSLRSPQLNRKEKVNNIYLYIASTTTVKYLYVEFVKGNDLLLKKTYLTGIKN